MADIKLAHQAAHGDDGIRGDGQYPGSLLHRQALNQLHLVHDGAGVLVELFPILRQLYSPVGTVENVHFQLALQVADGFAEIWLRGKELLRRLVEAALVGDRHEIDQLLKLHSEYPFNVRKNSVSIAYRQFPPTGFSDPFKRRHARRPPVSVLMVAPGNPITKLSFQKRINASGFLVLCL